MSFTRKTQKPAESTQQRRGRPPVTPISKLIASAKDEAEKNGHKLEVPVKHDTTAEVECMNCGERGGVALFPPPGKPKFSGPAIEGNCAG